MAKSLDDLIKSRVRDWQRLSKRFRVAQEACESRSDEWYLNKESADVLDRCIADIESDLALELHLRPLAAATA